MSIVTEANTIDSPDDEHRGVRNMYRTGINTYEKRIVRQVGYLQELSNVTVGQYVCKQTPRAPIVLRCWSNDDHNALSPPERNAVLLLEICFHQ